MEKTTFNPQQTSSKAHPSIYGLQNVENAIHRLTIDLESVKNIQIGRPARYYLAYRSYTLDFGIMQLENLIHISQPYQKLRIKNLLSAYYLLKSFIHN